MVLLTFCWFSGAQSEQGSRLALSFQGRGNEDLLSVTISCVVQVKIHMDELELEHNSDSG